MAHWRKRPDREVLVEELGDCIAVYSVLSGETHLLDALPHEVLRCLSADVPLTGTEVCRMIAELMQEPPDVWEAQVARVLERLQGMRLVERYQS